MFGYDISEWATWAGLIVSGLVLGWLLGWFARTALRSPKLRWSGFPAVAEGLGRHPVLWGGIVGGFAALETAVWSDRLEDLIRTSLIVLLGASLTFAAVRFAGALARVYSASLEGGAASASIFLNLIRLAVLVIGLLAVLSTLGISITPMLTALGVGGLAVALALQDTLSNLFAGLQIISSRMVRAGDYVELSSGEAGFVEDVNWRYTTIRQLARNMVVVPNATLASTIFTNHKLPAEDFGLYMAVGVAYDSDLDLAERIAKEVASEVIAEFSPTVRDFEPSARFHTFGDSSIDMTIVLRAGQFDDQWEMRHQFVKRLKKRFDDAGIEIPFPQRTVHMA
ncbi:MAG: mechanosensitive ion channel family protein [Actinomycetota bacterium]